MTAVPISQPTAPAPGWIRNFPPMIKQTALTCWACAAAAWVKVTPRSPATWWAKTVKDLREQYKPFTGPGGGLKIAGEDGLPGGLEFLAAGLGMDLALFGSGKDGKALKGVRPVKSLTGAFLYQKLSKHGHLYIITERAGAAFSHAVVAYGIGGATSPDANLVVMDSMPDVPPYRLLPVKDLHQNRVVIVGWPDATAKSPN